jgi:hypothetical protein
LYTAIFVEVEVYGQNTLLHVRIIKVTGLVLNSIVIIFHVNQVGFTNLIKIDILIIHSQNSLYVIKIGGINEKVRIKPSSASLQSVIGMMDYWSNEIFCFEKRDNGLFAELYIGEINDNF